MRVQCSPPQDHPFVLFDIGRIDQTSVLLVDKAHLDFAAVHTHPKSFGMVDICKGTIMTLFSVLKQQLEAAAKIHTEFFCCFT